MTEWTHLERRRIRCDHIIIAVPVEENAGLPGEGVYASACPFDVGSWIQSDRYARRVLCSQL